MSKVIAFQTLRDSIQAAQDGADDYKTALWLLINYAGQLKAYQWPTNIQNTPVGWAEAQNSWADMTGRLSGWAESTLSTVIELPTNWMSSSKQTILPTLRTAISEAGMLVQNPNNTGVKNDLLQATLPFLVIKFNQFSSETTALISSLESQSAVFDQDAQTLQSIANVAVQGAGADKDQIDTLSRDILNLRADISSRAAAIAGGSILAIAGLGMGILAIVTGGVGLFLLVPAVIIGGAGVAIIALNALAIKQDKKQIDDDNSKIDQLNGEIAALNIMASDLQNFASQVDGLKSALSVVIQPWQAAEYYFSETIATLAGIEEATSEDWQQVQSELQNVEVGWKGVMTIVKGLLLTATVSNAQLAVGMDENQVQQALNNGQTMDLIQYLAA